MTTTYPIPTLPGAAPYAPSNDQAHPAAPAVPALPAVVPGPATPAVEEWPEPEALRAATTLPPFPVDIFPPVLRDWVLEISEEMQTPLDLAGVVVLAMLAGILQKKFAITVRPDGVWGEQLSLYTAVFAESGEKKSPIFARASAPITTWERQEAEAMKDAIVRATVQKEIATKRAKIAIDQAAKAEGDTTEAVTLMTEADRMPIPRAMQLIADDVTPEKLAVIVRDNGGRMMIASDEGGIIETMAGRYAQGRPNIDIFLKGFAGTAVTVQRKNSQGTIAIAKPAITMALCAQRDVLNTMAQTAQFRGRGLLARFLFSVPESRVGFRNLTPDSMRPAVSLAYDACLRRLLQIPIQLGPDGEMITRTLQVPTELYDELLPVSLDIERRLRPHADLDHVSDFGNKLAGMLARIAALLAITADPERYSVSACYETEPKIAHPSPMTGKVWTLYEYVSAHWLRALDVTAGDPELPMAISLLGAMVARQFDGRDLTKRGLHAAVRSAFPRATDLDKPLAALQEAGWVRIRSRAAAGRGGRASQVIEVHPQLRSWHATKHAA